LKANLELLLSGIIKLKQRVVTAIPSSQVTMDASSWETTTTGGATSSDLRHRSLSNENERPQKKNDAENNDATQHPDDLSQSQKLAVPKTRHKTFAEAKACFVGKEAPSSSPQGGGEDGKYPRSRITSAFHDVTARNRRHYSPLEYLPRDNRDSKASSASVYSQPGIEEPVTTPPLPALARNGYIADYEATTPPAAHNAEARRHHYGESTDISRPAWQKQHKNPSNEPDTPTKFTGPHASLRQSLDPSNLIEAYGNSSLGQPQIETGSSIPEDDSDNWSENSIIGGYQEDDSDSDQRVLIRSDGRLNLQDLHLSSPVNEQSGSRFASSPPSFEPDDGYDDGDGEYGQTSDMTGDDRVSQRSDQFDLDRRSDGEEGIAPNARFDAEQAFDDIESADAADGDNCLEMYDHCSKIARFDDREYRNKYGGAQNVDEDERYGQLLQGADDASSTPTDRLEDETSVNIPFMRKSVHGNIFHDPNAISISQAAMRENLSLMPRGLAAPPDWNSAFAPDNVDTNEPASCTTSSPALGRAYTKPSRRWKKEVRFSEVENPSSPGPSDNLYGQDAGVSVVGESEGSSVDIFRKRYPAPLADSRSYSSEFDALRASSGQAQRDHPDLTEVIENSHGFYRDNLTPSRVRTTKNNGIKILVQRDTDVDEDNQYLEDRRGSHPGTSQHRRSTGADTTTTDYDWVTVNGDDEDASLEAEHGSDMPNAYGSQEILVHHPARPGEVHRRHPRYAASLGVALPQSPYQTHGFPQNSSRSARFRSARSRKSPRTPSPGLLEPISSGTERSGASIFERRRRVGTPRPLSPLRPVDHNHTEYCDIEGCRDSFDHMIRAGTNNVSPESDNNSHITMIAGAQWAGEGTADFSDDEEVELAQREIDRHRLSQLDRESKEVKLRGKRQRPQQAVRRLSSVAETVGDARRSIVESSRNVAERVRSSSMTAGGVMADQVRNVFHFTKTKCSPAKHLYSILPGPSESHITMPEPAYQSPHQSRFASEEISPCERAISRVGNRSLHTSNELTSEHAWFRRGIQGSPSRRRLTPIDNAPGTSAMHQAQAQTQQESPTSRVYSRTSPRNLAPVSEEIEMQDLSLTGNATQVADTALDVDLESGQISTILVRPVPRADYDPNAPLRTVRGSLISHNHLEAQLPARLVRPSPCLTTREKNIFLCRFMVTKMWTPVHLLLFVMGRYDAAILQKSDGELSGITQRWKVIGAIVLVFYVVLFAAVVAVPIVVRVK
jgi:hypothetical protein